jgi:hypothetical protein
MIGTTGSRIEGGEDAIVPIVRAKTTERFVGAVVQRRFAGHKFHLVL